MKPIQKYPKPGRVSLSFPTLWDQTVNKTSGAPKALMLATFCFDIHQSTEPLATRFRAPRTRAEGTRRIR